MEYIINNLWLLWILISLLCLIIELTNGELFIICLSIGGIVTAIVSGLGITDNIAIQILIFAVISILSIFYVRPIAKKYINKSDYIKPSNVQAIIGRKGIITETIEKNGYGRVQIDGDYWKAKSINNSTIYKGEIVKITSIDSIIVTVEKNNN